MCAKSVFQNLLQFLNCFVLLDVFVSFSRLIQMLFPQKTQKQTQRLAKRSFIFSFLTSFIFVSFALNLNHRYTLNLTKFLSAQSFFDLLFSFAHIRAASRKKAYHKFELSQFHIMCVD